MHGDTYENSETPLVTTHGAQTANRRLVEVFLVAVEDVDLGNGTVRLDVGCLRDVEGAMGASSFRDD